MIRKTNSKSNKKYPKKDKNTVLNMHEYHTCKFKSQHQSIAVAYSQIPRSRFYQEYSYLLFFQTLILIPVSLNY